MAKITRKNQKVFGSNAAALEIAQFGSLAAATPTFTTDPETIQALGNYLGGWFDAVIGQNSPAIEDMNAICFLYAYQLSYLMQTGIAEWNDETTYYIGSLVNNEFGKIYVSIADDNLNNALTDVTKWKPMVGQVVTLNPSTDSPYLIDVNGDNGKLFLVRSSEGAMEFDMPDPTTAASLRFQIKDRDGEFSSNPCTIDRFGSELIERVAADYIMESDFGTWEISGDGTNWAL